MDCRYGRRLLQKQLTIVQALNVVLIFSKLREGVFKRAQEITRSKILVEHPVYVSSDENEDSKTFKSESRIMIDSTSPSKSQAKERASLSKSSQVNSETWFMLMHSYLRYLFDNPEKEKELKILRLESLASSLGRNIVERCAEDKSGRYRDKKDIIRFLTFDVWPFVFGKNITKIEYKDEGETYFLHDSDFKFLRRIAPEDDVAKEYISFCMKFVCHLIRSVLKTFSLDTLVTGETQNYIDYNFMVQFKI